jgi:sialate O-acetylesterase
MAGKAAKLFLGRIIDADETYVNGQLVGKITYQYPPRRYQIPAGLLKAGKNVITVRVTNSAGKGGFVPDKRYELTDGKTVIDLRGDWLYQVGLVYPPHPATPEAVSHFRPKDEPTGLYNTMVAPAIKLSCKRIFMVPGRDEYWNKKLQ